MTTMTTPTPANDNATAPLDAWTARVRGYHPAHAARSFACYRAELGADATAAREITAQAMTGKRWAKGDARGLTYQEALDAIEVACSKRDAKRAA